MSSKRKSKPVKKNPSPTAKILENVEILVALHEELNESTSWISGTGSDTIVDEISQKLESQIEKRFDAIESKLSGIEGKLKDADSNQLSASTVQGRFEELDTRLEKVSCVLAGQQQLIEARTTNVDASEINSLRDQFSKMLGQVKSKITGDSVSQILDQDDEHDDQETSSQTGWSGQKQPMLSEYEIATEHDSVLETTTADDRLNDSTDMEAETGIQVDSEEIQRLTEKMKNKLRDAEVELSIERAKLMQLEVELESKQVELERRDQELSQKYSDRKNFVKQNEHVGMLDRLKKHLRAKHRKNLDRI